MNKQELIESLRNEYIQGLITEDYYKGKNWGINIALGLVNQLDETKITEEQAWGIIADKKQVEYFREVLTDQMEYRGLKNKIKLLTDLNVDDFIKELAKRGLGNTDIEPPKTLQVIVKNYDSTVYKTEIPEDEAMKLIEGWKEDVK